MYIYSINQSRYLMGI